MHTGLGLHITRRLLGSGSGASALLAGETDGLAFDFTNQSALIRDTSTPANAYNSIGIVSDGALVGPSGKLTYTSPSNKLTMQSDGYYKYQAHNLILQSEALATTWLSARVTPTSSGTPPPGYSTSWLVTLDSSFGTSHYIAQTITVVSGAQYAFEICAKQISSTHKYLALYTSVQTTVALFDLSTGTYAGNANGVAVDSYSIESIGDGWYKCRMVYTTNSTSDSFRAYVTNNTSTIVCTSDGETMYMTGAHLYRYPANTDYIKTTDAAKYALPIEYDTSGNCLGLLVEEQRTNLCYPSVPASAVGVWATGANLTFTSGQPGIFGINSATRIEATTTAATMFLNTISSVQVNATSCVVSFYVKKGSGATDANSFAIRNHTTATNLLIVTLNYDTLAVSYSVGATGATATQVTSDGWIRLDLTVSSGITSGDFVVFYCCFIGTVETAGEYALVNHVEFNAGTTFPTSPILTYGAAATRNGDNIYMPLSSTPLPGMTGASDVISGYAQFESANESSPGRYVFIARHEAGGNANTIYVYQSTSTQLASATTDAGAQTAFMNPNPNVAGADWQVAWRAKNDDYAISVAGLAQQTDTTADVMGVALDRLYIGNRANIGQGNRTIQKIVFVPSEWSNATLEEKVGN